MTETKEKTKLEILLFEKEIGFSKLKEIIGAKWPETAREKVRGNVEFKLSEMKAIQTKLFPDMSLEEIFEGY